MVAAATNVPDGMQRVSPGNGRIPEHVNDTSTSGNIARDASGIPIKEAAPAATQGEPKSDTRANQQKTSFFKNLSKPFKRTATPAPSVPRRSALFENNGIDRNELRPASISEEEEAACDDLWKARELSADSLARLEIHVEKALSETSAYGKVDPKLVGNLWEALQRNTAFLAAKYQFENQCGEPVDFKGDPLDGNQLKEPAIRNQRKLIIPEAGEIQLIKSEDGRDRKNECFPTNHVHPTRNWRISETPSEDDVGNFRHMLLVNKIGIIVDLTPGYEKYEHGSYAPQYQKPKICDQLHINCDDSPNAIHGIANFKNLVLTPTDSKGAANGGHVNVARFHVHSLTTMLRRPFNRKHEANVLNQVCELIKNKIIENSELNKSEKYNYKKGILFHGPNSNGTSAMLKTMLSAILEIEARFDVGNENKLTPEELTNEFILRTALKHAAVGRELGGPNFIQKKEQFELVVEALIQRYKPHMNQMKVEKKIFEQRRIKYAPRGFAPVVELEAARKELEKRDSNDKPEAVAGPESAPSTDSAAQLKRAEKTSKSPEPTLPLPARAGAADNSGSSSINALWNSLLRSMKDAKSAEMRLCSETSGTNSGIPFPSATALHYKREVNGKSEERFLNANEITFSRQSKSNGGVNVGGATGARACAGRSPRAFDACQDFLVKGIESGEGLFQFVSPAAHKNLNSEGEKPMMRLFQEAYDARGVEGLLIGGRYKVVRQPENFAVEGEDCKRMKITVIDTKSPTPIEKSIILTQAGLKFQENKLCAAEIKRADALMEGHLSENAAIRISVGKDPIVVSYTGIGRNATLIAYRQACARLGEIKDEGDLNKLLLEVVSEGRKGRGPGFIHSAAQLEELRLAIVEAYKDRVTGADRRPQSNQSASTPKSSPSQMHLPPSSPSGTDQAKARTGSEPEPAGGNPTAPISGISSTSPRGEASPRAPARSNTGIPVGLSSAPSGIQQPEAAVDDDAKARKLAEEAAAADRERLAKARSSALEEDAKQRRLAAFEKKNQPESTGMGPNGIRGG